MRPTFNFDQEIINKIRNESFKKIGRIHDWRNYVPYEAIQKWATFSDRERFLIWYFAETEADAEEWD
jgi:hypothetical protein